MNEKTMMTAIGDMEADLSNAEMAEHAIAISCDGLNDLLTAYRRLTEKHKNRVLELILGELEPWLSVLQLGCDRLEETVRSLNACNSVMYDLERGKSRKCLDEPKTEAAPSGQCD